MNKNFKMPAEWKPHERTLIEWPVRKSMLHPENQKQVCAGYAAAVKAVSRFEKVMVLANADTAREAEAFCGGAAEILILPHDDAWMRDNGPTFVRDPEGRLAGVRWIFNAWGRKYRPYDLDALVAERVLRHFDIPCLKVPLVLEGGSIHTDGEGTLLTTEQCLLNPNRNPTLSREQIAELLKQYLGVSRILWLKRGLDGDETDGHVDNVACFSAPGAVLMQECTDPSDPNFIISKENRVVLESAEDASGRGLRVIAVPQPPARFFGGRRLTLSYLNFYLVNGGVILPVFGGEAGETDREAVRILRETFPDREVVPVDGAEIAKEGGNIHCITQQIPAGIYSKREEKP